jgi:AcrR family transcriptional regulator
VNTQRARHLGPGDTPVPRVPRVPPDARICVASVTGVTEVARTAPRPAIERNASVPAEPADVGGPPPLPPGPEAAPDDAPSRAVVRALPTEFRGNRAAPAPPARTGVAPPAPDAAAPAPDAPAPAGDAPATGAAPQPSAAPPAEPSADPRPPGKRELRRRETRERIVDAAADLFAERGFDSVSVIEIARRAGVVEKTVFNHFPVKEGLVFDADPPVRAALLDTVRRRPAGESVAAAAGTFVVQAMSLLGSPEAADGVARMARIVRGSRTLQVREREILAEFTEALAALIAEETDAQSGQLEPWLTAHAVLGLYASLLELARDRVLAGVRGEPLAAELRRRGRRGLFLLQFGLAGYAKRR